MTRTIRDFLIILTVTLVVGIPLMTWAADRAGAETRTLEFGGSDFYIPRPADRSDQVGIERLIASVDTPAELVGLACSVVGTSTNGESVHPNNYGMLRSNGDSVRIDGTEDAAQGVKLSDRVIVLGTTVQLFNVMLPDANGRVATSVDYSVRVTCTPATDDTTTTTTTPPSSTTPTTTPGSTTSTTFDSTTSTTSALPPVTSTTVPTESTTTTAPEIPPTTGPTDSTIPPVTSPPTLPFTGVDESLFGGIAMAGLALLLLGAGVLVAGRRAA
jgi:hypothetical protein